MLSAKSTSTSTFRAGFVALVLSVGLAATQAFSAAPPSPWVDADIGVSGDPSYAGSCTYTAGGGGGGTDNFLVVGSGSGMWVGGDHFNFCYITFNANTNCSMTARVASVAGSSTTTNTWCRAGVMIRQSLSYNNTPMVLACQTGGFIGGVQADGEDGANNYWTAGGYGTQFPIWVRIRLVSGTIYADYAPDNAGTPGAWTTMATPTYTMTGDFYLGLAVTANQNGSHWDVNFDNVTYTGIVPGSVRPYVVQLVVQDGLPSTGVDHLAIQFSKPMDLVDMLSSGRIVKTAAIVRVDPGTNRIAERLSLSADQFSYNDASYTLTWRLNGHGAGTDVLRAGQYHVELSSDTFRDLAGNSLLGGGGGLVPLGVPSFAPAVNLRAGGADIQVGAFSVPCLADWNSDGLTDLIVGEETILWGSEGKVRVYLNRGTNEVPVYTDYFYAQSGGADLVVPATGCLGVWPRVFDWDGDGRKDLVAGIADGWVKVFRNIQTDQQPAFDAGQLVQFGPPGNKSPINVGARTTVAVVDWNNDGTPDLLVGGMDGYVRLFLGSPAPGGPDFAAQAFIQDGNRDLIMPAGRAAVAVADLDSDGRKDLIIGDTDGYVSFFPNVGTDAAPVFAGGRLLQVGGANMLVPGFRPRSRQYVGDYNNDGVLDLLVGALDGLVRLYSGSPNRENYVGIINADPPVSTLVVSGFPSPTAAGTVGSFTVTAQDGSGNTVTAYAGTVHFTSSDSAAALPSDYTFVGGDNGTHSFSATLDTAGTQSITATDTGTASMNGTQSDITVNPGTLTKLALALSSPQMNGVTFTGANTLAAQDANGNTVTTFDASVDNVRITANAPLVGDVYGLGTGNNNVLNRSTDFVAGVADLTALGMRFVGNYATGTFTATSATGKSGTSGSVTINGPGQGQPGKDMQVVTWLTIPASVSIAWGAGTTGKTAGDLTPFDWTVVDATGGQLGHGETCVSNDANNNMAMNLENTSNTGTKARVFAGVANSGGWNIAGAPATDTFAIKAQLGANQQVGLAATAQELTATSRLTKGADQPLVMTVMTPTDITRDAGVQKTIFVVLTATPE